MTRFEVLYYPYSMPSEKWLRGCLLFYDTIRNIVSKDVVYEKAPSIQELMNEMPNAIQPISPKKEDIEIDRLNLNRMRKAYERIKKDERIEKNDVIEISLDNDWVGILGYSFLHNTKISRKVNSILKEYKLIEEDFDDLLRDKIKRGYRIVENNAGNLIMALIADKIARKYGWSTITDQEIAYTTNILNDYNVKLIGEPNSLLASSIIRCEIPEEISKLSVKEYVDLRDSYSEIREKFQRSIIDLNNLYRIEKIESKEVLEERIHDILIDFHNGIEKFRKSNWGSKFKRWVPFTTCIISTVLGVAMERMSAEIVCGLVSISFEAIDKILPTKETLSESQKLQKYLVKMQKDIISISKVKKLL